MSQAEARPSGVIGLIVNPRSGNDVRRVIASAGSSTLEDKVSIVRRVVKGAVAAGATRFVTHHEPHQIVRRATETLKDIEVGRLDDPIDNTEADTTRAAARMRELGVAVVVVLGGDGTNRAAAKGWPDLPVIPLSTGTNNAFPYWAEPTVAGAAAGLLARGVVSAPRAGTDAGADPAGTDAGVVEDADAAGSVMRRAKVVRLDLAESPDSTDVALIDAVGVADRWVGSLELFDPDTMRVAVLTRADPAAIGFSAVGGLLEPCSAADDFGVLVRFAPVGASRGAEAPATVLHAPTAPGHYADVGIVECRRVELGEPIVIEGPLVLAFDGERKRRLLEGQRAIVSVRRDGPRVVDVGAVMAAAAHHGWFVRQSP